MAEVTLDLLFRSLERMQRDISRIGEAQDAMRIEMRHRFDLVDRRLNDVEGRMADLEARVTGFDLRLAEVHMDHEKRLEALEAARAS